jgi:hypothetical protein
MSDDSPALSDELIDRILRGQPIDTKAPREAHLLAEWVDELRRPARPGELRGASMAVADFLWAKRSSRRPVSRPRQKRIPIRAGIAGAAVLGAVGGGVAVAAATGSLPAPLQAVAHVLFGAPSPSAGDASGNPPAGRAPSIQLPAEAPTPVPSQPPAVGISTPAASPEPASGHPDVSAETISLAPKGTDPDSTAIQQGTAPVDTRSGQPESPGRPAAEPTHKGEPSADVRPRSGRTPPRRERLSRPPTDVEPEGAPRESTGGPPANVEPKAAPPERPKAPGRSAADVEEAGTPPAPAVEMSKDPTEVVEQPGEE